MRILLFASLLLLPASLNAQKHDYQWFTGFSGGSQTPLNDKYGLTQLDFRNPNRPLIIERQDLDMNFDVSNAVMCDSTGNLLFYSNGEKIFGPNHLIMDNGAGLTGSDFLGYSAPQAVTALSYPNASKRYVIISQNHLVLPGGAPIGWRLYQNTIDMADGKGRVAEKLKLLVQDSMSWGKITGAKHANGRDWWVVVPQAVFTNQHYIGLLSPRGFVFKTSISGNYIEDGLGQAVFSPDGTKYIKAINVLLKTYPKVQIYDFDRCTGELSNQRTLIIKDSTGFSVGVAVSPDSRYLYVTRSRFAYQYDLKASDIAGTETLIAQWDGFVSNNRAAVFWLSQLAPDGRIYVSSSNTLYHLHYINFPHRRDSIGCQFIQHGIKLPVVHRYDLPNHPNYRLGPLDGSPCDTLGLDNHPLANFRWEHEDSSQLLRVTFTDLSAYEPESWEWDFGDGTGSTERYPIHEYPKEGVYQACLVVKNQYSADTFCQTIRLGVSAQDNPELQQSIALWPNPFSDRLALALGTPELGRPLFRLFDATGQLVREERVAYGLNELAVSNLTKGLYFWTVEARGEQIKAGKVVKVE